VYSLILPTFYLYFLYDFILNISECYSLVLCIFIAYYWYPISKLHTVDFNVYLRCYFRRFLLFIYIILLCNTGVIVSCLLNAT